MHHVCVCVYLSDNQSTKAKSNFSLNANSVLHDNCMVVIVHVFPPSHLHTETKNDGRNGYKTTYLSVFCSARKICSYQWDKQLNFNQIYCTGSRYTRTMKRRKRKKHTTNFAAELFLSMSHSFDPSYWFFLLLLFFLFDNAQRNMNLNIFRCTYIFCCYIWCNKHIWYI